MKNYSRFELDNGMRVLVKPDTTTRMASLCILYCVGSRDEHADKTGLAHLFEHLMFSNCGKDIEFDEIIQSAGGDSNAFTNTDTTQYFDVAPAQHLELLLQLEATRMSGFQVPPKELATQQKVVVEEFSEHYLNNPYGMFSHRLMALAYKKHPYRWAVIGMTPEHIEAATIYDVKAFYSRYYNASNAIMTICGDVDPDQVIGLVKKHFAHLSPGPQNHAVYPQEDPRTEIQMVNYYEDIPEEAIFIALPAPARLEDDFYALDFLTDLLSEGKSSILFRELKKELQIFTSIDCYLTASADPGLIIIEGKLVEGVDIETGEREIMRVIDRYKSELISDRQWAKYRTKNETAYQFSQMGVVNQALNLSYAEWLGKPDLINDELERYLALTKEDIQRVAQQYFRWDIATKMYYRKQVVEE